jgi:hypothetical protein
MGTRIFGSSRASALQYWLFVVCYGFFSKVSDEMEHERIAWSTAPDVSIVGDDPNFYDESLSRILQLLRDEAKSGGRTVC